MISRSHIHRDMMYNLYGKQATEPAIAQESVRLLVFLIHVGG